MEIAIGERFKYNGKTYVVKEDKGNCKGCDLYFCDCSEQKCDINQRKDRTSVIFKEVK